MAKQRPVEIPNKPIHEVRHRNIRAAIWQNRNTKGPRYSVTVSRLYKDGDTWKDSHSFSFDELLTVAKAMTDAHSVISTIMSRERSSRRATAADAQK